MSEMCTSSFVPTQVCAFTCLSQQIFSPHLFTLSFEGVKQELYRAPICQNWKYLRMIHGTYVIADVHEIFYCAVFNLIFSIIFHYICVLGFLRANMRAPKYCLCTYIFFQVESVYQHIMCR